jgi:hypothetical protein
VSIGRRFGPTGSATVPRRPSRSRVTRCRTSYHLAGERDQMPLVDRDLGIRQGGPDPGRIRRRRVNHHDLDHLSECLVHAASPVRMLRCGQGPTPAAIPARQPSSRRSWSAADRTASRQSRPRSIEPTGTGFHRSPTGSSAPVPAATSQPRPPAPWSRSAMTHRTPGSHRKQPGRSMRSPSPPALAAARSPAPVAAPPPRPAALPLPQLDGLPRDRQISQPHHRPMLHRGAKHLACWTRALPCRLVDDHLHGRGTDPLNLQDAELVLKTEQR